MRPHNLPAFFVKVWLVAANLISGNSGSHAASAFGKQKAVVLVFVPKVSGPASSLCPTFPSAWNMRRNEVLGETIEEPLSQNDDQRSEMLERRALDRTIEK